jgi:hypothetical protein
MITNVEEFKEVIEGNYGIKDLAAYEAYKKQKGKTGITQEEVARLSPDNVDSCSFWEYIEKNPEIAKDAVAFGVTKDKSIKEANELNFGLACDLSTINYLLKYRECVNMPILDIGAGYGMLKEFVEKYTKLQYWGVDVYPKIPGVLKVASDGSTLPPNIMAAKFGVVVSTNVFQHLSVKQRRHYYEQVAKILYPNWGIFSVSHLVIPPGFDVHGFKDGTGKQYICHYGQYTEVQPVDEVMEDLRKHFHVMTVHQRMDDASFTFHCTVKPQQQALYTEKKSDTLGK